MSGRVVSRFFIERVLRPWMGALSHNGTLASFRNFSFQISGSRINIDRSTLPLSWIVHKQDFLRGVAWR